MKRYIYSIVVLLAILLFCLYGLWYFLYVYNCTHGVYIITIKERCVYNNSVGDDWVMNYIMDGKEIFSGEKLIVPLDSTIEKAIIIKIKEKDKYPDKASKMLKIALKDGETKTETINIAEDNGRFKGNTAKWEITISVKLIKKQ